MEPERSAGESGRPASRTHVREVDQVPFGGKPFAIELMDTAIADIGGIGRIAASIGRRRDAG